MFLKTAHLRNVCKMINPNLNKKKQDFAPILLFSSDLKVDASFLILFALSENYGALFGNYSKQNSKLGTFRSPCLSPISLTTLTI